MVREAGEMSFCLYNARYIILYVIIVPLYELMKGNPARIAVLPGRHCFHDGQRFQLLPDDVRLEAERIVGQGGSQTPDKVYAVLLGRSVGQWTKYFHAAGPIYGGRGTHAPGLRILSARFRVIFLRDGNNNC